MLKKLDRLLRWGIEKLKLKYVVVLSVAWGAYAALGPTSFVLYEEPPISIPPIVNFIGGTLFFYLTFAIYWVALRIIRAKAPVTQVLSLSAFLFLITAVPFNLGINSIALLFGTSTARVFFNSFNWISISLEFILSVRGLYLISGATQKRIALGLIASVALFLLIAAVLLVVATFIFLSMFGPIPLFDRNGAL